MIGQPAPEHGFLSSMRLPLQMSKASTAQKRQIADWITHHQQQEAIKRLNAGKETQGQIARSYNVSRWTISRLAE